MGLKAASRVRETSTTTGTGTYTLAGASTGYRTFSTAIGNGNTCHYVATDGTGWEVGVGTVGAGTLARTTILASSNSGSAVSWTAGTRTVMCTMPGEVMIPGALKIGSFTRDISTASGTQAVTGVGFTGRRAIFISAVNATATGSIGFDDGSVRGHMSNAHLSSANDWNINTTHSIRVVASGGQYEGLIQSWDSDGFTISWTKTTSPTGTLTVVYCVEA